MNTFPCYTKKYMEYQETLTLLPMTYQKHLQYSLVGSNIVYRVEDSQ